MEIQALTVKTRQAAGKGGATKVRSLGNVPAVLYGGGQEPVCLDVNLREFEGLVQHSRSGDHAIVRLEVADSPGVSTPALLKDVQRHPLRGQAIHVDFLRISLDERISTLVPIRLDGHAQGIVEGGVLDQQMREVEVECRALDVPDEIIVDISNLGMGESIHLSQVAAPANVTFVTDLERPVAAIHAPRTDRETTAEAEEEEEETSTQPEVIGEKKEKE